MEYKYREKFGLSNAELMEEPIDKFWLNLKIMELEAQREAVEIQKAQREIKR